VKMRMLSICIATIALLIIGCSKEVDEQTATSEPALSRQYRHESVTVIISVSKTNIATSGKIQLMLDVQVPPGTSVGFPEIDPFIEPFTIFESYSEPMRTLPNGKTLHRLVWQLAPSLSGETLFKPLEIGVGTVLIKTEPILIGVSSLLPKGLDAFEIRDIAAPANLLPEQRKQQRLWLILLATSLAIALTLISFRLRRRTKPEVVVPPHVIAFHALENLPDEPLLRLDTLLRILLDYIGTIYGIPMAGKTNKDILQAIPRSPLLGHRDKLVRFLETSEQVRFSHMLPDLFVEESEQYVRRFVEDTKEETCG
jgi:hypothetical protein